MVVVACSTDNGGAGDKASQSSRPSGHCWSDGLSVQPLTEESYGAAQREVCPCAQLSEGGSWKEESWEILGSLMRWQLVLSNRS